MTTPGIVLGIIISSFYGTLFHFWRGGNLFRLILYLILSWFGFWAGHIFAVITGWNFATVGTLHLGMATIGSLLFLGFGYWLSLVQIERK